MILFHILWMLFWGGFWLSVSSFGVWLSKKGAALAAFAHRMLLSMKKPQ